MGFRPQNIWRNTCLWAYKHNPTFMNQINAILNYDSQSAKLRVTISLISHDCPYYDMEINIHISSLSKIYNYQIYLKIKGRDWTQMKQLKALLSIKNVIFKFVKLSSSKAHKTKALRGYWTNLFICTHFYLCNYQRDFN